MIFLAIRRRPLNRGVVGFAQGAFRNSARGPRIRNSVSWDMPAGPILIFDKSALQALSLDESNWLDNFFMTNITPLFFAETLADLEKEVGRGKTPEEVVGHLAFKTPDMQATACGHHEKILGGDLYGHHIP